MFLKAKAIQVIFIGLAFIFATNVNANQYELAIDGIQSSVSNQPVSFGMVFGDEEVSFDEAFNGTIWIDGQEYPLPVQVDRKASFCSDSSFEFKSKTGCSSENRYLRHGIFSAILPASIPQGERAKVLLNSGGAELTGSRITFPGDLDVRTELSMDGDVWIADLGNSVTSSFSGDLPTAGTSNAAVAEWIAGPVAREWIVRVPFVNRSNSSEIHDHLIARYHVRHYEGSNTRIDTVIENTWSFTPGHSSHNYAAQIFVNNVLRYEDSALTHFPHARWKVQLWENAYPEIQVIHDPNQIIESRAVPNYTRGLIGNISNATRTEYDSAWSETSPTIAGGVLRYEHKRTWCFKTEFSGFTDPCDKPDIFQLTSNYTGPMGIGVGVNRYMKSTGGRPDIAPLPEWVVVALLDQRYSAHKLMLSIADGAGSWPVHIRDDNTDQVLSLIDHPTLHMESTVGGSNGIETCNRSSKCLRPYVPDTAHQASFVYYPYLITGDYFYLEELQYWATYNAAQKSPFYRAQSKGLVEPASQTRAMGWTLRTLGQTSFITPDENSLKEFYLHMLKSNIDDFTEIYVSDPAQSNTYGLVAPGTSGRVTSPWMQDYVGWASGYIANMGYDSMKKFAKWKGKFAVQRMGFDNSNYCWIYGANYHLWIGPKVEVRPESGAAQTVIVRNKLGTGIVDPKEQFSSIDDVWIHSNTATNGGYDMVAGGKFSTTQVCGSAEMGAEIGLAAGQMKYDTGPTNLAAQMQTALAVAVDMGTNEAPNAWNRFANRTSPPNFKSSPQWSIEPLAISMVASGALPTNGYTPIDNTGEQVETSLGQCVVYNPAN